jgi:hypothetical protein
VLSEWTVVVTKSEIPSVEGSIAWFEKLRRRCVDHFRALASVQLAQRYSSRLTQGWGLFDDEIASALHATSVIAYARPFTTAKAKQGNIFYPVRDLQRQPGFDAALHRHLMALRNQLIAHSDYGVLRSTMYMQAVGDSQELPVSLGLNVKRLVGIESKTLAERYLSHLDVCVARISAAFDVEFKAMARHVRDHPEHFRQTQNIPTEITQHGAIDTLQLLPKPSGAAGGVKEPAFEGIEAGYKYQMITHQVALVKSGTYDVQVNGKKEQYHLKIDGPEI